MLPVPPSFDLVVATVGRVEPLGHLLASLEAQTHQSFRVVVVDQNDDARLESVIAGAPFEVLHLRSPAGLARARNAALPHLDADVVGFPDDDCTYPGDLLERVAHRLVDEPSLDGVSGRTIALDGRSSASWRRDAGVLTDDDLWNAVNSASIFVRREVVSRVGDFDTQLGLGAGTEWSSGEEIDYVIRAVRDGARIAYDPEIVVTHDVATLDANERRRLGYRDGASIGYLLGKHRYPNRVLARMAIRPIGGAIVSLARLDRTQAGVHLATLRGRLAGYRATRASKIAA